MTHTHFRAARAQVNRRAYLITSTRLDLESRFNDILVRHHASGVADSGHFQFCTVSGSRQSQQPLKNVVHGQVRSAANQKSERLRAGWGDGG